MILRYRMTSASLALLVFCVLGHVNSLPAHWDGQALGMDDLRAVVGKRGSIANSTAHSNGCIPGFWCDKQATGRSKISYGAAKRSKVVGNLLEVEAKQRGSDTSRSELNRSWMAKS